MQFFSGSVGHVFARQLQWPGDDPFNKKTVTRGCRNTIRFCLGCELILGGTCQIVVKKHWNERIGQGYFSPLAQKIHAAAA
jgi:hypothetical protein